MSKNINPSSDNSQENNKEPLKQEEFGGQKGPEPTRFGDWERNGRVTDF